MVFAPQRINTLVAGDGEDPGGNPGPPGIEQHGLLPDCQHRLLRQLLGRGVAGAATYHPGLDPRREDAEQCGESGTVAVVCNGLDQCSVAVGSRGVRDYASCCYTTQDSEYQTGSVPAAPNGRELVTRTCGQPESCAHIRCYAMRLRMDHRRKRRSGRARTTHQLTVRNRRPDRRA